ncbi:hypothetical protein [Afipia sp. DC4300-2b1]|uniref:hypothetical protein n=1 Tax=Afipia sp. DC4300-2b1 TaxID=2804672 RepID=UPI003CFB7C74
MLSPLQVGAKLVVIGASETIDGVLQHVGGRRPIGARATFPQRDAAIALDYGHLTAAKAAELAAGACVKQLVLNHISGSWRELARSVRLALSIHSHLLTAQRE